jgi:hypothetical protein
VAKTVSGKALAIAPGHAMQVFNICIIQIDAGLLAYHDQLSWLACHWILYNIIYTNDNNTLMNHCIYM